MEKNRKSEIKVKELEQYDYAYETDYMYEKNFDYAYPIGMFFIYFSELEHNIDVYISNMISDKGHEFSYSIIGFLKFDNKIDVFKNLSRKYIYFIDQSPILIKKLDNILNDIIDDMRKIQEFRNNLAHSYWNTTEKGGFVRRKILHEKNGLVGFKYIKILPRNIKGKVTKINSLLEKLYSFSCKIGID